MKSKGGGGLFGIFKKKTTPAPAAPAPTAEKEENGENGSTREKKNTSESTPIVNAASSSTSTDSQIEHVEMDVALVQQPRKGSIAKTSVIHYSPPGTVRTSLPPSSTPSVVSADNSDENSVVITRKSNIVLDDEESVISTPISQYDESPIVFNKPRKKQTAAPPPPVHLPPISPTSPPPPPLPTSSFSSFSPQTTPTSNSHYRQTSEISRTSSESTPPILPPHRSNKKEDKKNGTDYEGMLKNLQNKFDEWHQVRIEDGGSVREERIKAEVLKEHEKLKVLLEKEIAPNAPKNASTMNNNNNNYVKLAPQKSTEPPKKVPGGTVYQKIAPQLKTSKPSNGTSSSHTRSRSTDENKNEIRYSDPGSGKNSAAVDRLRKEVEEQRQREREVKQYRNPKTLSQKTQEPLIQVPIQSPTSPGSGPRMVEYKPMKSLSTDIPDALDLDLPPPIPKTPPPKLAEYRKESPRMPTTPQNGYVRLQVGVKKVAAPVPSPGAAPVLSPPTTKKIPYGVPYTGPEYASSPKLLRKNPVSPSSVSGTAIPQVNTPKVVVKEKEIVYQKPQHPQMSEMASAAPVTSAPTNYIYQKIASSSSQASKSKSNPNPPMSPPIPRSAAVNVTTSSSASKISPTPSNYIYQKSSGASRITVNAVTSSPKMTRAISQDATYQKSQPPPPKSPTPVRNSKPTGQMMTRAASQDVPGSFIYQKSTVFPPKMDKDPPSTVPTPTLSATSPVYQKITVVPVSSPKPTRRVEESKATIPIAPKGIPTATPKPQTFAAGPPNQDTFDISDVLKGPKLRKVGLPTEKSGISLGKVLDEVVPTTGATTVTRPSTVPPPPPAPPKQSVPFKRTVKPDIRDTLMIEIREAGRLRAARASQNA